MSQKTLTLPCGFDREGARVSRQITLQKPKGSLQRDVGRQINPDDKYQDVTAINDTILRACIVAIDNEPPPPDFLDMMLMGDRDWLLFELTKMMRGTKVTLKHECDVCKPPVKMEYPGFDLDTLKVWPVKDPSWWWDGDNLVSPAGVADPAVAAKCKFRVVIFEHPEQPIQAVFNYPTGKDQRAIKKLGRKPVEAMWKLMGLTLVAWYVEKKAVKLPPRHKIDDFYSELDMDVLEWAQKEFLEAQPGIEAQTDGECENGHKQVIPVRSSDFLFRMPSD